VPHPTQRLSHPPRPHRRIARTLATKVHSNQLPHRSPMSSYAPSLPPPWRAVPPHASPMAEQGGLHRRSTVHTTTPTMEVFVAAAPRAPAPPAEEIDANTCRVATLLKESPLPPPRVEHRASTKGAVKSVSSTTKRMHPRRREMTRMSLAPSRGRHHESNVSPPLRELSNLSADDQK
jgi:hypothetical protein